MGQPSILTPLLTGLIGLGGVWLGSWLSDRREVERRRADRIARQLDEFYGLLLSLGTELQIRQKLSREIATLGQGPASDFAKSEIKALHEKEMPLYRQMVEVFRHKASLAEDETHSHYENLLRYVEIVDRYLAGEMSSRDFSLLMPVQKHLLPFYEHLESIRKHF